MQSTRDHARFNGNFPAPEISGPDSTAEARWPQRKRVPKENLCVYRVSAVFNRAGFGAAALRREERGQRGVVKRVAILLPGHAKLRPRYSRSTNRDTSCCPGSPAARRTPPCRKDAV